MSKLSTIRGIQNRIETAVSIVPSKIKKAGLTAVSEGLETVKGCDTYAEQLQTMRDITGRHLGASKGGALTHLGKLAGKAVSLQPFGVVKEAILATKEAGIGVGTAALGVVGTGVTTLNKTNQAVKKGVQGVKHAVAHSRETAKNLATLPFRGPGIIYKKVKEGGEALKRWNEAGVGTAVSTTPTQTSENTASVTPMPSKTAEASTENTSEQSPPTAMAA